MVLPFLFFPPSCFSPDCGSGRDEEPSGGNVLRLIQIRLICIFYTETGRSQYSQAMPNLHVGSCLMFAKHSQLFIRTHDKTLYVAAVL